MTAAMPMIKAVQLDTDRFAVMQSSALLVEGSKKTGLFASAYFR